MDIHERNEKLLKILLVRLNIDKTLAELRSYESVFLSEEYIQVDDIGNNELKRAILYGNLKSKIENNVVVKTNKKEILFNLGKKFMKSKSDFEVEQTLLGLRLISKLIQQLKLEIKIGSLEVDINDMLSHYNLEG